MNTDHLPTEQTDTIKAFLKEEIESTRTRLNSLKDKIKEDDFNSLDADLDIKSGILDSLEEGDIQLFLLRRELGLLRENLEGLTVKQGWWSRLSTPVRVAIITTPVLLYFLLLAVFQLTNPSKIYYYPATQAVFATQTAAAIPGAVMDATGTPSPTPTANP